MSNPGSPKADTKVTVGKQNLQIRCFGNQKNGLGNDAGKKMAAHLLSHMGTTGKAIFVCPPDPGPRIRSGSGGLLVVNPTAEVNSLSADAIVFTCQLSRKVAAQSRDCPWVILHNPTTGAVAMVHCMRDYLRPDHSGRELLGRTLDVLSPDKKDRQRLLAYISPGISADWFKHDQAPSKVHYFLEKFGEGVFTDLQGLGLNLTAVVTKILTDAGIPEKSIGLSNVCTYEDPRYGSLRADRDGHQGKGGQNFVCLALKGKGARN